MVIGLKGSPSEIQVQNTSSKYVCDEIAAWAGYITFTQVEIIQRQFETPCEGTLT